MNERLIVMAMVWGLAFDAPAQTPSARPQTPSSLQVYLITIGQGAAYWEKYGHNMLVFRDPSAGLDVAYNWGTFSFDAPDFLARQLVGDPMYWVEAIPVGAVLDFYTRYNRTITLQRLNLTPAQASTALEFSRWNAREENKRYRYDYFRDNCSTRVRDVIDSALGGALKAATIGKATTLTYRSETVRLLDDMKFTQLGVSAALGRPSDRALSTWEAGFIPMRLRDAIRDVRVAGPDGSPVPLVAEERVIYTSSAYGDGAQAARVWLGYLIVGVLIGVELLAMGVAGERNRRLEVVFRVEAAVWTLATGILGVIFVLAWTGTQHVFWYGNENLLLFNPLSLWLAVLLVMALRNPRWLRPAAVTSAIVALSSALALILNGIPGVGQDNLALAGLTMPAHFAIAFGLWRRASPQSLVPSP